MIVIVVVIGSVEKASCTTFDMHILLCLRLRDANCTTTRCGGGDGGGGGDRVKTRVRHDKRDDSPHKRCRSILALACCRRRAYRARLCSRIRPSQSAAFKQAIDTRASAKSARVIYQLESSSKLACSLLVARCVRAENRELKHTANCSIVYARHK